MGIKLIVEFMDYGPATLTASEWKAMVVVLEDANDASRLTWSSVTDPKIVRRIGLSPAAWTNLRGSLVRKGALEVAVPGKRGQVAKYRVPVFAPMGHGIDEETAMGHGIDEALTPMPHETHDESAERVMGFMTPTPPYSSTTSSSATPPAQRASPHPVAPVREEEESCASNNTNRARLLLSRLPAPWTLGPLDAQRLAPQLAATADQLGWPIGDKLAAAICTNPGGMNNPADVLASRRIPNLLPYAAVHGHRTDLPPACPACLDQNPAAETNKRWRTTAGQPCPNCHPDALSAAA